ncbi:hypothetical protein RCH20_001713 [Psychrobacter sp. PL15]|nr:hypothetical protein [Psychrobacter sp. PL15]
MAVCQPNLCCVYLIHTINNRHDYLLQTGDMRKASIV